MDISIGYLQCEFSHRLPDYAAVCTGLHVISGLETKIHNGPVFHIHRPKTGWFGKSTAFVGRKEWNAQPAHIRLIDNYDDFKRAVKGHYHTSQQQNSRMASTRGRWGGGG